MPYHSGSTRFREIFEAALRTYQTTTGVTLTEHPLAIQVQSCRSVESIATRLKDEARAFGNLQGSDTIMKSIESTVSILSTLPVTTTLGEASGLVRQNA
jgi:hypothetical protein